MNDANPFATRYVRPGAVEFLFPAGGSLQQLVSRLEANGWRGEIVGPHGSGKSTLLHALIPELTRRGLHVTHFSLRNGARALPYRDSDDVAWYPPSLEQQIGKSLHKIWIVDGAEQLSWFHLRELQAGCWWSKRGLLCTSHRSLGLPLLMTTVTSPASAWHIVKRLLPENDGRIEPQDVEAALAAQKGDMRETLMALFDLYHERQRKGQ